MGSLCEIIIGRLAAPAFSTNVDLVPRIHSYLDHEIRLGFTLKAHIIQYSAANALEIVRAFVWRGIETDLYVILPKSNHVISTRQRKRVQDNIDEILTNLRRPDDPSYRDGLLRILAYDTPGAIRAVMVERILDNPAGRTKPDFIAIGTYVYMKIEERKEEELDIRGGEMPGIILRPRHDGFDVHASMICGMLKNWHLNAKCEPLALRGSKNTASEVDASPANPHAQIEDLSS
jgi:hypothetical protein